MPSVIDDCFLNLEKKKKKARSEFSQQQPCFQVDLDFVQLDFAMTYRSSILSLWKM